MYMINVAFTAMSLGKGTGLGFGPVGSMSISEKTDAFVPEIEAPVSVRGLRPLFLIVIVSNVRWFVRTYISLMLVPEVGLGTALGEQLVPCSTRSDSVFWLPVYVRGDQVAMSSVLSWIDPSGSASFRW